MMKMKKPISVLLVAMMMTSLLVACDSGADNNDIQTQTDQVTEVTTEEEAEEVEEVSSTEPEALGSGNAKWSEMETDFGYSLVMNEGGDTLGYSKESGIKLIQVDGFAFKDLNQNGLLDGYEDWRVDDKIRAMDLATQLDVESITGLMLYSKHQFAISGELNEDQINFLDAGGRSVLNAASGADTKTAAQWNNAMQAYTEGDGVGIPVSTSSDPRDNNVSGIPSNLALAATFDTELAKEMGSLTSIEYRLLGIATLLGPQVDVTTEPRWNRIDGTFGDDPALSRDLTKAFVNGVQSTYDEKGNDLGWGSESMATVVKHWPGEGAGEGGREGHANTGNAQVFPGGMFETQLIPFVDGAFDLDGKTETASAVMSSYSIAYDEDETYGELVGTSFSDYKVKELLREKYAFDGFVVTDWGVLDDYEGFMTGKAYGVFDLTKEERALRALLAGVDQFGGFSEKDVILGAYELGVDELGDDDMRELGEAVAVRVLKASFALELFENPYVDVDVAQAKVMSEEFQAKAFEAQLKSVVMLKNDNAVVAREGNEKPTVYMPMNFIPYSKSHFGVETKTEWKLPIDEILLSKYFNVVTDTPTEILTGTPDADGNPTVAVADIVRASAADLKDVDFAFSIINDPANAGNYFAGFGYDKANEAYIPISLQYGPYTANSEFVREESISGDMITIEKDAGYGVEENEEKENRSYFGKSSIVMNYEDVNTVKYASETVPADIPVVVAIKSDGPMIFSEIEPFADGILIAFGGSIGSGYGIEEEALIQIAAGKYEPSGLLPVQMPSDMLTVEAQLEDVPRDMTCYTDSFGNKYDFTYGMNWSGVINDSRTETYGVETLTELSK